MITVILTTFYDLRGTNFDEFGQKEIMHPGMLKQQSFKSNDKNS